MKMAEKEYIERDEVLQKISRMIEYCKKDNKVNGLTALFQAADAVIDCKSAYVQEVVRCKDCKYLKYDRDFTTGRYCSLRNVNGGKYCKDDDFCSYGKRKDGNER